MTICAKNDKKEYSSLSEERKALLEKKKIERTVEAFNNTRKTTHNKKYIFVRLIKSSYKSATNVANFLDKGIRFVDKPDKNTDLVYNHATCSAMMLDGFYGLTLSGNKFALMKEFITKIGNKNKFMTDLDLNESIYALYAAEVDSDDYDTVKKQLDKFLRDPNLTYSTISIIFIGLDKILKRLVDFIDSFRRSKEADSEENKQVSEKIKLVCSSFIAFVFYKYTKLKEKLDEKELKYTQVSPTDLVSYIPNMKLLHYDKFPEYNKNCEEYVKQHKEFKPFFTR